MIAVRCHRQTKSNLAFSVGWIAPPGTGDRGAPLCRLFQTVTWSCLQMVALYALIRALEIDPREIFTQSKTVMRPLWSNWVC